MREAKFPVRALPSLLRDGFRAIFSENLSEVPPEHVLPSLPLVSERLLRAAILARGIKNDNYFLARTVALAAKRLIKATESMPPQPVRPLPVFHVDDGPPEEFRRRYVERSRPAVLRGYRSGAHAWTVDGFIKRFGDMAVYLTDVQSGAHRLRPLKEISEHAPSGGSLYAQNTWQIFEKHPELIDEAGFEGIRPFLGPRAGEKPFAMQAFISKRRSTGTIYHCANLFNVNVQIVGEKEWTFIDPNFMLYLYPFLSETNTYQSCLVQGLDPASDEERFPMFRRCPRYSVVLRPGDVLINPTWWYHAIRNVSDETMAVTMRWLPIHNTNRVYNFLFDYAPRPTTEWNAHDGVTEAIASGRAHRAWFPPGPSTRPPRESALPKFAPQRVQSD
jgi:hypothetical protein